MVVIKLNIIIMMISTMPDNMLNAPCCIGTWQMVTIFQRNFKFFQVIMSNIMMIDAIFFYSIKVKNR